METSEYILWRNQNRGILEICLIKFGLSRSSFYSLYECLPLVILMMNNSDYLKKARKYGHFTGYKN